EPGPARPEPRGPCFREVFLELGEPAEFAGYGRRQRARGFASATGLHDLPEERMVRVTAAVVPDRGSNPFGKRVKVGDELLDGLALMLRVILQRGVDVIDVR